MFAISAIGLVVLGSMLFSMFVVTCIILIPAIFVVEIISGVIYMVSYLASFDIMQGSGIEGAILTPKVEESA
ncbi:hypothetical protein Cantr_05169 [Candida viswanathii]|uniref:Uncharacterized protein n=1 Tax=Candida viswanathii TaxID=5486 RepID=A0A367XQS7_9ASCO|nr:hypothetical protein Cantr_05169 [Candida viswanathii]